MGNLAIDSRLKDILRCFYEVAPIDYFIIDSMDDLAEDSAITDVFVKVVHEDILNAKRVDPESEGSFFARSLDVIVVIDCRVKRFLFFLVKIGKAVFSVEDLSDEKRVDFSVSLGDIFSADNIIATDRLRVVNADLCTSNIVSFSEAIEGALAIVELV